MAARQQAKRKEGAGTAFVQREPSSSELLDFNQMLSTATDGSGRLNKRGRLSIEPRLMESAAAEAFNAIDCMGMKDVFDNLLRSDDDETLFYGLSCKSKALDRTFHKRGRLYVEYANASEAFLAAVAGAGYSPDSLKEQTADPVVAGNAVIEQTTAWHNGAQRSHVHLPAGGRIDLDNSRHLVLTYDWDAGGLPRYELHVYPHVLPTVPVWGYTSSGKCLQGFETQQAQQKGDQVYDYYPFSGGQLKWYPRRDSALMHFGPFTLLQATKRTLKERSRALFGASGSG